MTAKTQWNDEMDAYLKAQYHAKSAAEIGDHFGISRHGVMRRARVLGIKKKHEAGAAMKKRYSPEEDDMIIQLGSYLGGKGLAPLLNRSINSIWCRAKALGVTLTPKDEWALHEDWYMMSHLELKTDQQIGEALGRGHEAVRKRRALLNQVAQRRKPTVQTSARPWSDEEVQVLKQLKDSNTSPNYPLLSTLLLRTQEAVRFKFKSL